jgi:hypothetical protein
MTDENKSEGDIYIGDQAAIDGDVFTGGKHIHHHYPRRLLGIPFQAPVLPVHFVPRHEISDLLKSRLLAETATVPGVLAVSAIHGLGGIGKSTLAAALAHDSLIQKRFADGVLWATLGQQPDLLSLLGGWVQALGDYDFRPTAVEATSAHLRSLLQDKAALLIVDDVWDPAHIFIWQVGGPHSRMLITTRRADVAEEVGAELHQLDVMTAAQSLALLSARLDRALEEPERAEALRLATAVGHLPLALELAAARISRGATWMELCAALKEEVARLEALEGPRGRRQKGVTRLEASFNLSLNALQADDEAAYQAFIWLGILPEDVLIGAPMAATLWSITEIEAAEILELLWNDALLRSGAPILVREKSWPAYRLHDLLHNIARRLLGKEPPQGLGLDLPAAQTILLQNYRQKDAQGMWHTLPDDGYIQFHLTWHMEQAKQFHEIHALLGEETIKGQNGWYATCEGLGQTAGFLEDVAHAWQLAELAQATEQVSAALGWQCRYALITASLNSLAKNIPPALLAALIQKKAWSATQGLAYVRRIPNPTQRVEGMLHLLPHLPETLKSEAVREMLRSTQMIQDSHERTQILIKLFPLLAESGHTQEALAAVHAIKQEADRAEALVALAPHLSVTLLHEALSVAWAIGWIEDRTKALVGLIPYLPELLRQEIFVTIRSIAWSSERAKVLIALIPHLPEFQLREVLALTEALELSTDRAKVLVKLAPYLTEPLLEKALVIAQAIQRSDDRVLALTGLIPRLATLGYPAEALAQIKDIYTADDRAKTTEEQDTVLIALVPQLIIADYLDEALQAAQAIHNVDDRAKTLADLVQQLAGIIVPDQLLAITEEIERSHDRAKTLFHLIAYLPDQLKVEALLEIRAIVRSAIWEAEERAITLVSIIPQLAEAGYIEEAIITAQEIELRPYQALGLVKVAHYLSEPVRREFLQEALATTKTIPRVDERVRTLLDLSPHLSDPLKEEVLAEALDLAPAIRDVEVRTRVLTRLIPDLAQGGYVEAALDLVRSIRWNEGLLAQVLSSLAPYLPQTLLSEALAIVWQMKLGSHRSQALSGLAPYLPASLLQQALAVVQAINDRFWRVETLAGLTPWLAELGSPEEVIATIQTIGNDQEQAKLLIRVAPKLAQQGHPAEALAAVQLLEIPDKRFKGLVALVPELPRKLQRKVVRALLTSAHALSREQQQAEIVAELPFSLVNWGYPREALQAAQVIKDEYGRAQVLGKLCPRLVELGYLHEALTAARATHDKDELLKMVAYLPKAQRDELLQEVLSLFRPLEDIEQQALTLTDLTAWLGKSGDPEAALVVAQAIQWSSHRAIGLANLAPYLPEPLLLEKAIPMAQSIPWPDDQVKALV